MEHADAYAFYQRNVTDRSDLKAINISAVD